ncbi:hypothetical protein LXL04_025575 [Taraxacum kok-saghyz]
MVGADALPSPRQHGVTKKFLPTIIGSSSRCLLFEGMIARPLATSDLTNSGSRFSRVLSSSRCLLFKWVERNKSGIDFRKKMAAVLSSLDQEEIPKHRSPNQGSTKSARKRTEEMGGISLLRAIPNS